MPLGGHVPTGSHVLPALDWDDTCGGTPVCTGRRAAEKGSRAWLQVLLTHLPIKEDEQACGPLGVGWLKTVQ